MEKRLWEYRTQSPNEVTASLFSRQHGIAQLMQFSDGTLLLHTIDEGDSAASAPVQAVNLESDLPFTLLPEAFQDSGIPGWQGLTQKASLDGTVVCYAIEDKTAYTQPCHCISSLPRRPNKGMWCIATANKTVVLYSYFAMGTANWPTATLCKAKVKLCISAWQLRANRVLISNKYK